MAGLYKLHIFDKNGIELIQRNNTEKEISECDLYMDKVSVGLVETNNLIFASEDRQGNLIPISKSFQLYAGESPSPYQFKKNFRLGQSELDSPNDLLALVEERYVKILLYIDTQSQTNLRFFTVNTETDEITWTNKILIGCDEEFDKGVHLGFTGEKEGVYETAIYICEVDTNAMYPEDIKETDEIKLIGQINTHNVAIGEDTRYRHMFKNFGIPDPITYLDVFKDSTIFVDSLNTESEKNEYYRNHPNYHKYDDKIDYEFLNEKSKELYLTYSEIFPYVGTYKALINAVDYLGYDDIYFKEWFKELSDNPTLPSKNVSYEIAYKSGGNSLLTKLPLDRKISLKKLNWLSMIYKISEFVRNEKGEIEYEDLPDNVRIPLVQNNYSDYDADEILIKLVALKEWLEKNIIGLNCRIIEINGEGIVVGRLKHRIYGKKTTGSLYHRELSVTPFIENSNSELEIRGEKGSNGELLGSMCKLRLGLHEQNEMPKEEFIEKYKRVQFKAYLETNNGAFCSREIDGITYGYTDVPIIIKDGEIFFDSKISFRNEGNASTGNEGGSEAVFIKLPMIQLESAKLKNLDNPWKNSTEYVIDDNGPDETPYRIIRNATSIDDDNIFYSKDYITLRPHEWEDPSGNIHKPSLKYTTNNRFGVPLFILENYLDESALTDETEIKKFLGQKYILEILDGKFIFNDDCVSEIYGAEYTNHVTKSTYINFHYDEKELEQHISINYVYSKIVDMADYAASDRTYLDTMSVQNIGDYTIVAFVADEYNTLYCNQLPSKVTVYMRNPSVCIYTAQPNSNNKEDFYNKNMDGSIVDYFETPLTELNVEEDHSYDEHTNYPNDDSMFYLFLDNSECKMQENYLISDVSIVDASDGGHIVKYATYPTISYAIDTPKNNNIAHFMNISDKFYFVGSASESDVTSKYYVTPDESNSNIMINDKFIVIWLKRNKVFEGNALNDGIGKPENNKDMPALKNCNILIYDKIHNATVYQDYVKLNYCTESEYEELVGLNYIIINESVMSDIYMYYKNNINKLSLVKYDVETHGVIDAPAVQIEKTPDFDVASISDFLEKQRVFDYYIIPAYELPIKYICHYNENRNISTLIYTDECVANISPLFKIGDKVKLKYRKKVGENILIAQATFTVIESTKTSVTIDGYYSYGRLELGEQYRIVRFGTNSVIRASIISGAIKSEMREGTRTFRDKHGYTLKEGEYLIDTEEINYLLLSHANSAYVDYEIPVDYAIEKPNGDTELHVKDDEYLYFVDNTYSISTKEFSIYTAFELWMKETELEVVINQQTGETKKVPIAGITKYDEETKTWSKIYKYNIPVTLPLDDANIVITPSTTYEGGIQTFSKDLNERHSFWRIYKYDKYDDRDILLFESWNDALFMTLNEEGLYTIELTLFDNYGNVINRKIEGIFKVVAN